MRAGNMSPKVERHTAPTREMKGPKLGMAAAMPTEIKRRIFYFKIHNTVNREKYQSEKNITCANDQDYPEEILHGFLVVLAVRLDVAPDDLEWHVELKGVGQENSNGNHNLHRLRQTVKNRNNLLNSFLNILLRV